MHVSGGPVGGAALGAGAHVGAVGVGTDDRNVLETGHLWFFKFYYWEVLEERCFLSFITGKCWRKDVE